MNDQDRDWLDDRVEVKNYIPDDGFTARVVGQLPKSWLSDAESRRRGILILCGFFAAGFATGTLIMQIGPFKQAIDFLFSRPNRTAMLAAINHLALVVDQPGVLYGAAAGLVVIGFAAIPFLRRWV